MTLQSNHWWNRLCMRDWKRCASMIFPVAVWHAELIITTIFHKLPFLIWGSTSADCFVCIWLWICILSKWKSASAVRPQRSKKRTYSLKKEKLIIGLLASSYTNNLPIYWLSPFTDVQCNLWKGHCAQSAPTLSRASIPSNGIYTSI